MPCPCGSRRSPMHGTRPIPCPASARPSGTWRRTSESVPLPFREIENSLRPGADDRGALEHRPFVVTRGDQGEAIGRRVLPGRAEAVLAELPCSFALDAGLAEGLARDLAVGAEHHRVFDVLRR